MPQPPHVPSVDVDAVTDDAVILDVREPDEYAAGHVPGAVHVPMGAVPERISDLPEARLVVVCRSGGRSARVTAYLRQLDVDAVNMDGGMRAWAAASRPMESESGAAPTVI